MSGSSTPWMDLQTAGLVGTDRHPWRRPEANDPLGAALGGLPAAAPAQDWLSAAGVLAVFRLAGEQPTRLPPASARPCPPDSTPPCSSAAALRLGQMLAGQLAEALPEWLAAAAEGGWRAPADALPALLRLGQAQHALRPAIRAVIGRRGEWLAREYPEADYAGLSLDLGGAADALAMAKQIWETGARRQRLAVLEWLRPHAPAAALDLVRSSWAQDKADDRAYWVAALADNLSLADEDFLEAALDDSPKDMRRIAAGLLSRLPDSKLCQRMAARVEPLVKLVGSKRRVGLFDTKAYLEVTLPERCDEAAVRDGLAPAPPKWMGERAWWLEQMVGAAPLGVWPARLGAEPEQLIPLAQASEAATALLVGWAKAAQAQANRAWICALLRHVFDQGAAADRRLREMAEGLFGALAGAEREALLQDHLQQANANLQPGSGARQMLEWHRGRWGLALSRQVLDYLSPYMRGLQGFEANDRDSAWIKKLALRLHPDLLAEGRAQLGGVAEHQPQWARAVDEALEMWQFRHEMLKELTR